MGPQAAGFGSGIVHDMRVTRLAKMNWLVQECNSLNLPVREPSLGCFGVCLMDMCKPFSIVIVDAFFHLLKPLFFHCIMVSTNSSQQWWSNLCTATRILSSLRSSFAISAISISAWDRSRKKLQKERGRRHCCGHHQICIQTIG
jgi:hypothetical protein